MHTTTFDALSAAATATVVGGKSPLAVIMCRMQADQQDQGRRIGAFFNWITGRKSGQQALAGVDAAYKADLAECDR